MRTRAGNSPSFIPSRTCFLIVGVAQNSVPLADVKIRLSPIFVLSSLASTRSRTFPTWSRTFSVGGNSLSPSRLGPNAFVISLPSITVPGKIVLIFQIAALRSRTWAPLAVIRRGFFTDGPRAGANTHPAAYAPPWFGGWLPRWRSTESQRDSPGPTDRRSGSLAPRGQPTATAAVHTCRRWRSHSFVPMPDIG